MRYAPIAPVLFSLTFAACETAPTARSADAPVDAPASTAASDAAPSAAAPAPATPATSAPSTTAVASVTTTNAPATTAVPSTATTARQSLVVPTLEARCAKDDECAIFDTDLSGPTACCGGCTWHAATKSWLTAFKAACTQSPAPMCPPIGCAMPIVEPRCVAGKCVAAPKR